MLCCCMGNCKSMSHRRSSDGSTVAHLGEVQDKFKINVGELVRMNSLTSALVDNPSQIVFLLKCAASVYYNDINSYLPTALSYYQFLGRGLNRLCPYKLRTFFDTIQRADSFVDLLLQRATLPNAQDADLLEVYTQASSLTPTVFQRLLYFTVFTNSIDVLEVQDAWYTSARDAHHVRVYVVNDNAGEEERPRPKEAGSQFLFHGINDSSLYSLCRNGIASTESLLTGRNPGAHIQCSSDMLGAVAQSRTEAKAVLCFEIRKAVAHAHDGMVAVKEENLRLRAIVWMKKQVGNAICSGIASELLKTLQRPLAAPTSMEVDVPPPPKAPALPPLQLYHPQAEPMGFPAIATKKRVVLELQEIFDLAGAGDQPFVRRANNLVPGRLETSLLVEVNIPASTALHRQAARKGIDTILFACYLPQNYPLSAVHIRVVTPRFRRHTGRITFGGSVCTDLLYAEGWSPKFTVLSTLAACVSLMVDETIPGYGQIDEQHYAREYSYHEYAHAYSFTAETHMWKVK